MYVWIPLRTGLERFSSVWLVLSDREWLEPWRPLFREQAAQYLAYGAKSAVKSRDNEATLLVKAPHDQNSASSVLPLVDLEGIVGSLAFLLCGGTYSNAHGYPWTPLSARTRSIRKPLPSLYALLTRSRMVLGGEIATSRCFLCFSLSQVGVHGCCCCRFTDDVDFSLYTVPGCPEWSDP